MQQIEEHPCRSAISNRRLCYLRNVRVSAIIRKVNKNIKSGATVLDRTNFRIATDSEIFYQRAAIDVEFMGQSIQG